MNFFQRLIGQVIPSRQPASPPPGQRVLNWEQGVTKTLQAEAAAPGKGKAIMPNLHRQSLPKAELSVLDFERAIEAAEDPLYFDRSYLYAMYREIRRDGNLHAVLQIHQNNIISEGWELVRNEKPDKDAKAQLEKAWLQDFLRKCIENSLFGHALLEPVVKNGEVQYMELIPREHVSPERGKIYLYPVVAGDAEGFDFRTNPIANQIIEIGTRLDLGLLQYAGKALIRKDFADQDWMQHSERYGMPTAHLKTEETRDEELQKKEKALANLGANGWLMTDKEDEVNLVESTKANPHLIYKERMVMADQLINLLLVGSSSLGQEKAFVGSAEVSERIADKFKLAQMRDIQNVINDKLIPFLVRIGYKLDGCQFRFNSLYKEDKTGGPAPDPNQPEPKPPVTKKPAKLNAPHLHTLPAASPEALSLVSDAGRKFEALLWDFAERIYNDTFDFTRWLEDGTVGRQISLTFETLFGAFREGYTHPEVDWDLKDKNLIKKVYDNIFTFSGAKTNAQLLEMRNAVYDGEALRPWGEYRDMVLEINDRYNLNYLAAERQAVIATGQMGSKWLDIQATKDQFPYLKYVTVGDQRVREAHRAMEGIIRPVDDPFWLLHYPPNGWKCRCDVEQLGPDDLEAEGGLTDATQANERAAGNTDPYWRGNPGATGTIFKDTASYFAGISEADKKALVKEAQKQQKTA